MGRVCIGIVGYVPSLLCAELAMCRVCYVPSCSTIIILRYGITLLPLMKNSICKEALEDESTNVIGCEQRPHTLLLSLDRNTVELAPKSNLLSESLNIFKTQVTKLEHSIFIKNILFVLLPLYSPLPFQSLTALIHLFSFILLLFPFLHPIGDYLQS